jgi:prepilin-type N-terminal cleavage/methylation domain-containing protein
MTRSSRAFTLIEMLIVVALLGLAGALVIPSMSSVGALRVQGALRTIVSDITLAQSDAIAFQEKRAMVFDVPNNSYRLLAVNGSAIDPDTQTMFDPTKSDGRYIVTLTNPSFGGSRITSVRMNGSNTNTTLIFDDMGTPIIDAGSDQTSSGGVISVAGMDSAWDIVIDAFTGRVSVRRTAGN